MNDVEAADLGWEKSARAWLRSMAQGDFNRVHFLDPIMLQLCGDVRGLTVLDVGCGEGRFCRMLAERGAKMIGVDPTRTLIAAARERHPAGDYHGCGGEDLPLVDASVDLVVSYVALIDIPDFCAAIREKARVLRPGGRCVVANLNGFSTASNLLWARDADGNKLHWTLDNYMVARPERVSWAGITVINWHRPLSAYMQAFLSAGLILEHFNEPVPTIEAMTAYRQLRDHQRMPNFHTMVWRKPA